MARNQSSFGAASGLFAGVSKLPAAPIAPALSMQTAWEQPMAATDVPVGVSGNAKGRPPKRDGLIQKTYYITPEQDHKLQIARVMACRDMSEIVRDAIDLYFARQTDNTPTI